MLLLFCRISYILINRFFPLAVLIWLDIDEVNFHERHNCVMDFYG